MSSQRTTSSSESFRKTFLRRFAKTTLLAGAVAAFLGCAGATYQFLGTWRDDRRFPQHGRSFYVGKTKLNLDCEGDRGHAGIPTVILDSGLGVPALGWIRVQPQVASFARVCSYDRAGYGWSDEGSEPRTSLEIAKELRALLDSAGERGPYVVVGHSFGGFNMRVFTSLFPAEVAGGILVEGSQEDEDQSMSQLLPPSVIERETKNDLWNDRVSRFLRPVRIRFGIERLQIVTGWGASSYGMLQSARSLPKEVREELFYLRQQGKFQRAVEAETTAWADSIAEIRKAGNFGSRPLIVLTADNPLDADPILTQEQMQKLKNVWIHVLQVREAHLSTRGKQIIVSNSTHMVPFDRPDAVVSAIHEVWSAVRDER